MTSTCSSVPAGGRGPVLELRGVTRCYERSGVRVEALRGVDLVVAEGELVALMGPSGCGKTTLLHVLGGLDRADAGEAHVAGIDLMHASQAEMDRLRQRHVGIMLQSENLISTATAEEQVALRLLARGMRWKAARSEARELLARVGLAARTGHRPDGLSGGEQQRVALARALAGGPQLVLADEPTGELDSDTTASMLALIHRTHDELGCTFVIATHDQRLASIATRVVHLHDGMVQP